MEKLAWRERKPICNFQTEQYDLVLLSDDGWHWKRFLGRIWNTANDGWVYSLEFKAIKNKKEDFLEAENLEDAKKELMEIVYEYYQEVELNDAINNLNTLEESIEELEYKLGIKEKIFANKIYDTYSDMDNVDYEDLKEEEMKLLEKEIKILIDNDCEYLLKFMDFLMDTLKEEK